MREKEENTKKYMQNRSKMKGSDLRHATRSHNYTTEYTHPLHDIYPGFKWWIPKIKCMSDIV